MPSRAIIKLYGRKYGYVPTIKKSRALQRIERRAFQWDYLQAVCLIDAAIAQQGDVR